MEIPRCDCSMGYVTVGPGRTRRFISVSFGKGSDRRSQTVLAERKALLNKGARGRADCNYLRMTVSAGDQIISDVSRDQSRQKTCSSCGVRFTCGPTGGKGCWCEELAHVSLVAGADQDCLCPACLSAAIAKLARAGAEISTFTDLQVSSPPTLAEGEDYYCEGPAMELERTLSFTVKATPNAKSNSDAKPSDSQTDEVLREWRESAFYWQKHLGTIRTIFQPVTEALIKEAGLMEGETVLDVAGGSGEPSLTIAETIGPTGSVTYTDAVAEMVTAAESEAQRRGLTNVTFRQCAADALPFENNSFDAVVCRLGIMFFPDPLAGLREMLRVTKREGMLSLAVWGKSDLNPFSYLITNVVARHFEPAEPANPNAPGAFRFAEPSSLARIFAEAGAVDVRERELKFNIAAPISPEQFWELRAETSGTLREKLATLSPSQADLLKKEAQLAFREYFSNNQMSIPAQMIIVTGRKP